MATKSLFNYLLALFVLLLYSKQSVAQSSFSPTDTVYKEVDQMPEFVGGKKALIKYTFDSLRFAWSLTKCEYEVQGRAVVRFVVDKTGVVRDPFLLRGLDERCDTEAIRLVLAMPKWNPGRRNGEAVNVYYILPIIFR